MKITSSTFEKTIETNHIPFCVLREGKIESNSLKFKVTVQSTEPFGAIWIGPEGSQIELKAWFRLMLAQKLVLTENSECEKYFRETIFVNDVSLSYIAKTLFQILERLLLENLILISLEYE